jgi:hypothetical protein
VLGAGCGVGGARLAGHLHALETPGPQPTNRGADPTQKRRGRSSTWSRFRDVIDSLSE